VPEKPLLVPQSRHAVRVLDAIRVAEAEIAREIRA
jgi:hypothetical protein